MHNNRNTQPPGGSTVAFQTRKPTGKPGFPMIILAGIEGSGKTWAAAEATGMDMVDRAFFIEVGESMADEYGAVPGADFEIVQHDGTIGQILQAVEWATQVPAADGKVNMLIVDSISIIWEMIKDGLQITANERTAVKARRYNKPMPKEDVQVGMDLWNRGADLWSRLMTQCRNFPGPVLTTARLNNVVLMDDKGQPSKDRDWKIEAHKSAPYSAQVVVQAREPRVWTLTKAATTSEMVQSQIGRVIPDFTVEKLMSGMGIDVNAQASTYVQPKHDGSLADEADRPQQAPQQQRAPQQKFPEMPVQEAARFRVSLAKAQAELDLAQVNKLGAYAQKHGFREQVSMAERVQAEVQQALQNQPEQAPAEHPAEVPAEAEKPVTEATPVEEPVEQTASPEYWNQNRPDPITREQWVELCKNNAAEAVETGNTVVLDALGANAHKHGDEEIANLALDALQEISVAERAAMTTPA